MSNNFFMSQEFINSVQIITNVLTSLGSIATCGSIIFLYKQLKLAKSQIQDSKNEFITSTEYMEKNKAIELAQFYATELVSNISIISSLFNFVRAEQIITDKLDRKQLKNFDVHELLEFFNSAEIKLIDKRLQEISNPHIYKCKLTLNILSKGEAYDRKLLLQLADIEKQLKEGKLESDKTPFDYIKSDKYMPDEILSLKSYYHNIDSSYIELLIVDTLNALEAFCMHFNNGVADEEVIYQSLHQSFLGIIKLLYFKIASKNQLGKDKYYINIIQMYNRWNDRYKEQTEKEVELSRQLAVVPEKIKKQA